MKVHWRSLQAAEILRMMGCLGMGQATQWSFTHAGDARLMHPIAQAWPAA
jgi:hypothetical protein